jgi:hypothetical protein
MLLVNGLRKATITCAMLAIMAPASHAIVINLVPTGIGNAIGVTGVNATAAPAGAVGGGTLDQAFQTAAWYWQSAILDNFTVTINYGWGDTGAANTLGFEQTQTYAGAPNRITQAGIVIKSQTGAAWFADPTPDSNSEYGPGVTTNFADAALCNTAANCVGIMTTGVVYSGSSIPIVQNNTDLLSVVIHEVGHALGLDVGYAAYVAESGDNDIDLTGPRAFAGANIFDLGVGNAHLDDTQGNLVNALMQPAIGVNERRIPSAADILAVCQVSSFTNCSTSASIPEPAPSELLLTSAIGLFWLRRRFGRA